MAESLIEFLRKERAEAGTILNDEVLKDRERAKTRAATKRGRRQMNGARSNKSYKPRRSKSLPHRTCAHKAAATIVACNRILERLSAEKTENIQSIIAETRRIAVTSGSARRSLIIQGYYRTYLNKLEVRVSKQAGKDAAVPLAWNQDAIRAMLKLQLTLDENSRAVLEERCTKNDITARLYLENIARADALRRFLTSQHLSTFEKFSWTISVLEQEIPKSPPRVDPACWKSIWKKVLLDLREDLAPFAEMGLA